MKKLFFSLFFFLFAGLLVTAQTPLTIKEGDVMTYKVKSNGQEYNFIVTVKSLDPSAVNPVVFDWKMADPINKSGTIKIGSTAAIASNAFYNWFSGGEKQLDNETSVFISDDLNKLLRASAKGATVKIKTHGAAMADELFTVEDTDKEYYYTQKGDDVLMIKVIALKDEANGSEVYIYSSPQNAFIVSMNIGFEISLNIISPKK